MRVGLTPRDVGAQLRATCSDVSLDGHLIYEADLPRLQTSVQRRIETHVQLPDPGSVVKLGGVELCFRDGVRLSDLGLYANFAAVEEEHLVAIPDAPPVWLGLTGLDLTADDRFKIEATIKVTMDRNRNAVRVGLASEDRTYAAYSLADGLVARVDSFGYLKDLTLHGIEWIDSRPV